MQQGYLRVLLVPKPASREQECTTWLQQGYLNVLLMPHSDMLVFLDLQGSSLAIDECGRPFKVTLASCPLPSSLAPSP